MSDTGLLILKILSLVLVGVGALTVFLARPLAIRIYHPQGLDPQVSQLARPGEPESPQQVQLRIEIGRIKLWGLIPVLLGGLGVLILYRN